MNKRVNLTKITRESMYDKILKKYPGVTKTRLNQLLREEEDKLIPKKKLSEKLVREVGNIREDEDSTFSGYMDTTKITNLKFEDIDYDDYPDYCDAFISEADYDGEPMTEEQLDELNSDREFVQEKVMEYLF